MVDNQLKMIQVKMMPQDGQRSRIYPLPRLPDRLLQLLLTPLHCYRIQVVIQGAAIVTVSVTHFDLDNMLLYYIMLSIYELFVSTFWM